MRWCGVRDYVGKNRFPGVLLDFRAASIGVDAGRGGRRPSRDRVRALMLPSRYNASISLEDAREMAHIVAAMTRSQSSRCSRHSSIRSPMNSGIARWMPPRRTFRQELRTPLMALSNKFGSIVLTTGNKSRWPSATRRLWRYGGRFQRAQGYQQDTGVPAGALSQSPARVIPERMITRPPSAELRANQTDRDALPPYDVLDAVLEAYVEQDKSPADRRHGLAVEDEAGGTTDQDQRIQAAPGGGRHPHHAARLRQGLAISNHVGMDGLGATSAACRRPQSDIVPWQPCPLLGSPSAIV